MFIYKYILYNGSICICNLAICFVPKRMKKINYEMKLNFNAMNVFIFFWLEKRNDIWTNVTQIVCKARAKRDREREGGVREERERVIGTGW